jgi:uncharacterized membrane-anchored protein
MILSEETYALVRTLTYLIGIPIITGLCISIVRRLRAIRELDAQVRQEEAQNAQNPYAQMAALYQQQEARDALAKAKRGKVK